MSDAFSICQTCGACCASFRVSFYANESVSAQLPDDWIEPLTPFMACMRGTNSARPHCAALQGTVGETVTCVVYPHRPPACREVMPGDDKCTRARAVHGMPPLPGTERR